MIKIASEKPKEVEYIEFEGSKNFKEVAAFLKYKNISLIIKPNGNEFLSIIYKGQERKVRTGTIIHRTYDYELEEYDYVISTPEVFYRQYQEVRDYK